MRTMNSIALLGLLLLHSVFGQTTTCSGCSDSNPAIKVATWNTNLTPGSTLYQVERTQEAIRLLTTDPTASGLDLLCLQEVYTMSDMQGYIAGLNHTLPYSYSAPIAAQSCSMVCTAENIASLNSCTVNCLTLAGSEAENCLYQQCGAELGALPTQCQICLGISSTGNLNSTLSECTAGSGMSTTSQECKYLYGGSSGNLILSKYPITVSRFITFNNTDNIASGALHIRIEFNGIPINFFCTSLLPSSSASSSGTDMTQLNQMQAMELMDWIENGVNNNEPIIVAGSLSQGPEMNSQNFNLWTTAGYESVLLSVTQGQIPCTLCSTDSQNSTLVVDHILVKTSSIPAPCFVSAGVFASRTTVSTSAGSVPLSTHSGVSAAICYAGNQTQEPPSPTVLPSVVPTMSMSPLPTKIPTSSPVQIPVSPPATQQASEGGIAMPAVILAAVLVGAAMVLNR